MPSIEFSTGEPDEVAAALLGLLAANLAVLANGYKPDPLVFGGLQYVEDPPGLDIWLTIQKLLDRGWGDCADLAIGWGAYLIALGVPCSIWIAVLKPYKRRYHAYLRVRGKLFDPSVRGGMKPLPLEYYKPENGRCIWVPGVFLRAWFGRDGFHFKD
jgi:hypothetical protein